MGPIMCAFPRDAIGPSPQAPGLLADGGGAQLGLSIARYQRHYASNGGP
jgi:hypothetical protein